MRRGIATFGVTAVVVALLLVATQPAAAVVAEVSGPDEITHGEEASFTATIDIREDERVPIEGIEVDLSPVGSNGTATAVFAPNGTLQGVSTNGNLDGKINVSDLAASIAIEEVDRNADFGYGYLNGTDERTGDELDFGYGYGYGYGYGDGGQPSLGYAVQFDTGAFDPGNYTLSINVDTGEDAFASNEITFRVAAAVQEADVEVHPETLNVASDAKWVTGYIELPDGDVSAINISTVTLNGVPAVDDPKYGFVSNPELKDRDDDGHEELMVKFSRSAVADTVEPGENVTVTVEGALDSTQFIGEDTIRVIEKGGGADANGNSGGADVADAENEDNRGGDGNGAEDDDNGNDGSNGNDSNRGAQGNGADNARAGPA